MSNWKWDLNPTLEGTLLAVDRLGCGILVEDRDAILHYANRRILELTGYEAEELDGQPVSRLVPEELHGYLKDDQEKARAGDARSRLSALRRKDGRAIPVVVAPQWIEDEKLGRAMVVSVLIDLAEVHAARPLGARAGSLAAELAQVASRLQSISFAESLTDRQRVSIDDPALQTLSAREKEILVLLVQNLRVSAIAERLFISPSTVRNHLKAIYRKVGVSSQGALLEWVAALSRPGAP